MKTRIHENPTRKGLSDPPPSDTNVGNIDITDTKENTERGRIYVDDSLCTWTSIKWAGTTGYSLRPDTTLIIAVEIVRSLFPVT